jgi:acetyltransferase
MGAADVQVFPLTDGSKVMIRAIGVDDAPRLQAFVRRLSARSRRLRFFSAIVELSAGQLERLVAVDHRRALALVAVSERSGETVIVAEARYVLDQEDGHAEFAIAVADEFQRRGLGMQLLKKLVGDAARRGVRRLFGEILDENHAMLALAKRLGFQLRANFSDRGTMIACVEPSLH